MKKIDELKASFNSLRAEAQELLNDGKAIEAKDKIKEADEVKVHIEVQNRLDTEEMEDLKNRAKEEPKKKEADSVKNFAAAARIGFKNDMSEGSKPDGGYTVPEDISTTINELRESKDALQPYVSVEPVSTLSGARTFKKRSQQSGFAKVAEGGKIGKGSSPQFTRLEYTVDKYAGYFPVTNELLEDSDAAIVATLTKWIGDESRVTRNKLILEAIKTQTKTAIANLDGIKKVLNVTLSPAFYGTTKIYTNQDGLQHLDTLKDTDGRYLLQPMVGDSTRRVLFSKEVVVLGNDTMPSDVSVAKKRGLPFVIGDLKEGVVMFDRKNLNIKSSDIAMSAFEEDLTMFRAIEREDVVVRDSEAFIYGEMVIDDASVVVS